MKRILAIMLSLLTIAAVFALPMNAADPTAIADGLVIYYDGANNTGNGQDKKTTTWKDVSGNNNDFSIELDDYIKWTDNALNVNGAFFYFPDKAVEVINGPAWTVEIALGNIQLLGTNYDTFIFSDNDHFSIFRRTNNDSIEFKGNDAKAERVVVPDGNNLMNQSTVSVTYTLSGMVRIYVDGVLMGEMPQNGKAMEADTLALGHFDMKRYWIGDVHSIRFYDRELSALEVALNAEVDAIKYNIGKFAPETTIPETTEAPETTAAPETTKAPETTAAPETTKAPETQAPETQAPATEPITEAPPVEKGCGGFVAGPVAIIAILGTALITKKRD